MENMNRDQLMKESEANYLKSINKIMAWAMVLHLPLAMYLGHSFNTGIFFALFMSLAISSMPIGLTLFSNQHRLTSISYGVGLMCYSGLLIHLSKGMIELHFHIFVAIACMIIFANPIVILAAALTAAVHHLGFYFFLPESVFNYKASLGIVFVHAAFVIVETLPCMWISNKFRSFIIKQGVIVANIDALSRTMNDVIDRLNESNKHLNEGSESQSAAVTETAQTVHQISQMANQTAENAESSKAISENGKKSADLGKTAVNEMLGSIDEIKSANGLVIDQMHVSNKELTDIVNVIKQIESKAQIINEIVFQTKLLSFNASVEAARAGEHGKGFAVVAEEVGKLAQMSGNASKEISDLILTSVQKVENIAKDTEIKINDLVKRLEKSIGQGGEKAKNCGDNLEELAEIVHGINDKLNEISSAAKEQSQGINEMNHAIQDLESINLKNNESIKESVQISRELSELSSSLSVLISELIESEKKQNVVELESNKGNNFKHKSVA